jgi:hypothetical protein
VAIVGASFVGVTGVEFGGAAASPIVVNSASAIVASTPSHGVGTVDVEVSISGWTSTLVGAFTFTTPTLPSTPDGGGSGGGSSGGGGSSVGSSSSDGSAVRALQEITGLSPASGPLAGGNAVAVIGYGFTGATKVYIGAKSAAFTVVNDAHVEVTIPQGDALGSVDVSIVLTPARGRAFAPGGYVYTATPAPTTGPGSGTTATPSGQSGNGGQTSTGALRATVSNPAVARSLGGGVVILGLKEASRVPPVVAPRPVSSVLTKAPTVTGRTNMGTRVTLRGLPAATSGRMQIGIGGRFVNLGTATTSASGLITSSALKMSKPGTYALRVTTGNGRSYYLKLAIRR